MAIPHGWLQWARYSAAAVAGYAVVAALQPTPSSPSSASPDKRRRVAERSPLTTVTAELDERRKTAAREGNSMESLKASLRPADDVKGVAKEILAQLERGAPPGAEGVVRLYHWLSTDPEAALAWFKEHHQGNAAGAVADALGLLADEMECAAFFDLTLEAAGLFSTATLQQKLGQKIAVAKDGESLVRLLKANPKLRDGPLTAEVGKKWQLEDRAGMTELFKRVRVIDLYDSFSRRLPNNQALAWIGELRALAPNEPWLQTISRRLYQEASDMPLAERLAGARDPNRPNITLATVVANDLNESVYAEEVGDAARAFASGRASAEQVLDTAAIIFPELASGAPEQLRSEVFKMLATSDARKALQLLDDLAPHDRADAVNDAAKKMSDPKKVAELFQAAPFDPQISVPQERFEAWWEVTTKAYSTYGADYSEWVIAQPQGIDRDMALSSIALQIEKTHPEEAARLRGFKNYVAPGPPAPVTPTPAPVTQ